MNNIHITQSLNEKFPLDQLPTLAPLIEVLIRPQRLKRDLFFALLLILMRKNDFREIKTANKDAIDVSEYLVSVRRKKGEKYERTFILNQFNDYPMKLLVSPLSDGVLINALVLDTCDVCSVYLPVKLFVASSRIGIPYAFRKLDLLSKIFHNFISPIKNCIFNKFISKQGNILSLPKNIILMILLNLRIKDVLNLSESCKRMNCIVKEDLVWYRLYNRDFSDAHKYEGREWLEMYSEIYVFNRRLANNVRDLSGNSDYVIGKELPKLEVIL